MWCSRPIRSSRRARRSCWRRSAANSVSSCMRSCSTWCAMRASRIPRCERHTPKHVGKREITAWGRNARHTPPERGETGGPRGAAQGRRRPGGQPRRRASASTTTRRAFPPTVQQVRQRGCPCWNRPLGPPDTRCGAAASIATGQVSAASAVGRFPYGARRAARSRRRR